MYHLSSGIAHKLLADEKEKLGARWDEPKTMRNKWDAQKLRLTSYLRQSSSDTKLR